MFIIFLLFFYLLTLSAHLIVYDFLLRNFFADNSQKKKLLYAMLLMSFSFILASAFVHFDSNIISRSLYYVVGIWHGFLLNMIIFIVLFWLILLIVKKMEFKLNLRYLAISVIVFAVALSGFGIFNVYNIKTAKIDIRGEVWPDEWHGKRAVMISDVHLGQVLGERFLNRLIGKIKEENPDIIFISGDLFDGVDGSIDFLLEKLKELTASQGVYYVSGNHETYIQGFEVEEELKKTGIIVLDDELVEIDNVQIVGVSYPDVGQAKDLHDTISGINNYDKDKPSILLFHEPKGIAEVESVGVNLMLSGHTHKGQMWPFGFITKFIYKGADYGLTESDNLLVYTSSGAGVWGPNMRTSGRSELVVLEFGS